MRRYTITIDTNCINVREAVRDLNQLEKWHSLGLIEIVKTDVMDTELRGGARLEKSSRLKEDLGVGVVDHSRLGHFVVGGEGVDYPLDELRKILFPNFDKLTEKSRKRAIKDAMHLATHHMRKRDFFVTMDNHFMKARDELKKKFNMVILTPKECAEELRKMGLS